MRRVLPRGSVLERAHPHLFKGIPKCPDCNAPAVRLQGSWVCRNCFGVPERGTGLGPTREIPLASVLPNRAARRAAARR